MDKNFFDFFENKRNYFAREVEKKINSLWSQNTLNALTQLKGSGLIKKYNYQAIGKPINYFFSAKGKMLRPILGYLTAQSLGINAKKLTPYLIIPEILHNASLIIDDIEDNADKRRNKKTVHKKYGLDIAVNAANALYYSPFLFIKKTNHKYRCQIYEILIEAMNRVHIGQGLDILWHSKPDLEVTAKQYEKMVKLKTASFFRAEIQLAVLFAKPPARTKQAALNFAENIGFAFQIMDDLLDLRPQNKKTNKFGKTFAQDIKEGKKTIIMINALKKANKSDRKNLLKIIKEKNNSSQNIQQALAILEKYSILEKIQNNLKHHINKTWDEFSAHLKQSKAKDHLFDYCNFLLKRRF
jgi:geranylgeranyl pyrophosphate synthase